MRIFVSITIVVICFFCFLRSCNQIDINGSILNLDEKEYTIINIEGIVYGDVNRNQLNKFLEGLNLHEKQSSNFWLYGGDGLVVDLPIVLELLEVGAGNKNEIKIDEIYNSNNNIWINNEKIGDLKFKSIYLYILNSNVFVVVGDGYCEAKKYIKNIREKSDF